ncbi:MAG: beta-ketoacyl-[acyl-carrier-protein] synthase family protein [Thermodesulfobacteriota bacterium]
MTVGAGPRIVISGLGLVTPLGVEKNVFFQRLLAGETGIAGIVSFDTGHLPCHLGAEIKEFNPRDFISLANLRKMDRLSTLAAAAARTSLEDAGLKVEEKNRDRIGLILGVAYGGTDISVRLAATIFTEGPQRANPIIVPNVVMNAPAGHTSIELGIRGVNSTVNHHGVSAETALAYAVSELKRGAADAVLAGGADIISPFFYETMVGFKALSGSRGGFEAARPFDLERNGWVAGEGAGVICLEALERALDRGREPYAEILGWGLAGSPAPLTDWPADPQGAVLAIRRALGSAGLKPEDIDFICASANGGVKLDRLEAAALAEVFGLKRTKPLISSLKGALGESFSSGGLRTAVTAWSLRTGWTPATLGLTRPLAELDFILNHSLEAKPRRALVTALSPGGACAALILGCPESWEEETS